MRLTTTFDLAMTALIESTSLGWYFIGTICQKTDDTKYIKENKEDELITESTYSLTVT
jgi:hypothetical protein